MKRPALTVLQDTYQLTLNPEQSYYEQLQPLASSGHLSNKSLLLKAIFDLCQVIDKQAAVLGDIQEKLKKFEEQERSIKSVERKNFEISERLKAIESSINSSEIDPTQPLPTNS